MVSLEASGPLTSLFRYWQNALLCGCRAEVSFWLAVGDCKSTPTGHLLIILAQHNNLLFLKSNTYRYFKPRKSRSKHKSSGTAKKHQMITMKAKVKIIERVD